MTPPAPFAKNSVAGFTLIEVMVVVVIIGILINFTVLSLRSQSPVNQLNEEALRMKSLIEIASEEALLRSSLIGVDISETGYGFLRLEEEIWQPVNDTLLRNREMPATAKRNGHPRSSS
jgi:general secretion pathway protein H